MAEYPSFAFMVERYLADTGHLTDAEHGRYMLILMYMWIAPGQRLPNDDEWLGRKFRRSADEVRTELRPIISEFCQCDGNWITQRGLNKVKKFCDRNRKSQSDNAKSRWAKAKRDAKSDAGGNASNPIQSKKKEKDTLASIPKEKTGTRLPEDFVPDATCEALADELLLTKAQSQVEFDKFRDYWRSVPGAKGRKIDWQATFRNWLRNAKHGGTHAKHRQESSRRDKFAEFIAINDRNRPDGGEGGDDAVVIELARFSAG